MKTLLIALAVGLVALSFIGAAQATMVYYGGYNYPGYYLYSGYNVNYPGYYTYPVYNVNYPGYYDGYSSGTSISLSWSSGYNYWNGYQWATPGYGYYPYYYYPRYYYPYGYCYRSCYWVSGYYTCGC